MERVRQFGIVAVIWMLVAGVLSAQQNARPNPPPIAPRIAQGDFQRLHAAAAVLVIDVRDQQLFRIGHIPAAISVPLGEIDARAIQIRAQAGGRPIVTYCSCLTDHASLEAASRLLSHGATNVSALAGGYPAWVARGGQTER